MEIGFIRAFCFAFFKRYFCMLKNERLFLYVLGLFFETLNRYILLLETSTVIFIHLHLLVDLFINGHFERSNLIFFTRNLSRYALQQILVKSVHD